MIENGAEITEVNVAVNNKVAKSVREEIKQEKYDSLTKARVINDNINGTQEEQLDQDEYVDGFQCEGGGVLFKGLVGEEDVVIGEDGLRYYIFKSETGELTYQLCETQSHENQPDQEQYQNDHNHHQFKHRASSVDLQNRELVNNTSECIKTEDCKEEIDNDKDQYLQMEDEEEIYIDDDKDKDLQMEDKEEIYIDDDKDQDLQMEDKEEIDNDQNKTAIAYDNKDQDLQMEDKEEIVNDENKTAIADDDKDQDFQMEDKEEIYIDDDKDQDFLMEDKEEDFFEHNDDDFGSRLIMDIEFSDEGELQPNLISTIQNSPSIADESKNMITDDSESDGINPKKKLRKKKRKKNESMNKVTDVSKSDGIDPKKNLKKKVIKKNKSKNNIELDISESDDPKNNLNKRKQNENDQSDEPSCKISKIEENRNNDKDKDIDMNKLIDNVNQNPKPNGQIFSGSYPLDQHPYDFLVSFSLIFKLFVHLNIIF